MLAFLRVSLPPCEPHWFARQLAATAPEQLQISPKGLAVTPMPCASEWKKQGTSRFPGFFMAALFSLGPCFFLSCPIGIEDFRTWFIDLWNNSIIPYLQEGAKDGIKVSLTL